MKQEKEEEVVEEVFSSTAISNEEEAAREAYKDKQARAEAFKQQGNECFRNQLYDEAAQHYSS